MKTSILVTLFALSVTPAFADARIGDNPTRGEGKVLVSGKRGVLNVRIIGEAAKVLFDNMTDAKETHRRLGSLFTTTRQSSNLLCTFSAEVAMVHTCSFHLDRAGVVSADNVMFTQNVLPGDLSTTVHVEGSVFAGGERGTINVRFDGAVAKAIYGNMTLARETTRRIGSLFLTNRESDNLLGTYSAEVARSWEVLLHVESNGDVRADNVAWPM